MMSWLVVAGAGTAPKSAQCTASTSARKCMRSAPGSASSPRRAARLRLIRTRARRGSSRAASDPRSDCFFLLAEHLLRERSEPGEDQHDELLAGEQQRAELREQPGLRGDGAADESGEAVARQLVG